MNLTGGTRRQRRVFRRAMKAIDSAELKPVDPSKGLTGFVVPWPPVIVQAILDPFRRAIQREHRKGNQ